VSIADGEVLAGDLPLRVPGQVEAFFEVIGRSALAGGRANLPEPMQMTGEPTLWSTFQKAITSKDYRLLGGCPNIRDHQLRREFDSIKAAKKSRALRHHVETTKEENSNPSDSPVFDYSGRLLVARVNEFEIIGWLIPCRRDNTAGANHVC
jgi:hypothetical protein